MKIVVDPPDLRTVASRFVDGAADVAELSLRLTAAPRPELPAGFGDLEAVVSSVSHRLEGQSTQLLQEAARLRERAAIAQLGAAVTYALRDPRYRHLHGEKLKEALEDDSGVKSALVSLGLADNVTNLIASSRKWQRLEQIAAARGSWSVFVNPNVIRYGPDDYRTFRGYMLWQERVSHSMPLDLAKDGVNVARGSKAEAELASETGPLEMLGKTGKIVEVGGKGLTVVDVALNAYTLYHGSQYQGTRGDVDRGVAGASVLAGGTLLIAAAGVAPIPVAGEVAASAILITAGLWQAGNLIADNKKAIARGVTHAGKFVADHPIVAAPIVPIAPIAVPVAAAKEVYDHRHAIEHAGSTVAHAAGKALPWNWG